jgi:tryptophan synthase alpha subunit
MKKRKTLLLIYAASKLRKGFLNNIVTRYQPLSLGIIAALTPKDWKIKLIDENFREFRYYPADLVGITAFTSTVTRAYEIAQMYREKGTPVVLGGIHASMVPDEALQYVDSVVTGEAESAWPQLIQDFENGELKRIYHGILQPMIKSPGLCGACSTLDIFLDLSKLPAGALWIVIFAV